jgi:hypothetical protein
MKATQSGKEEKLSIFADDIIVCVEGPVKLSENS